MLDIRFVKENPELVKENIRKKFKAIAAVLNPSCFSCSIPACGQSV